jgi:hypothetical protein
MSEPTPPLDPGPVFATLAQHGVQYVVIGGVAAQLQGSSSPTLGVDITPQRSAPNLARVAAALTELQAREWVPGFGYPLQLPMDRRRLTGDRALLTHTSYGRVDVILAPHGFPHGYDELALCARDVTAYGKVLFVADVDDLLRSHAAAGRGKDVEALSRLRSIKQSVAERGLLSPHELGSPVRADAPQDGLQDALVASERLATVFDDIRPALAYVRRELYRAVDEATYGEDQAARTSIARAQHAASNAQADIRRLREDLSLESERSDVLYLHGRANDPVSGLVHQAGTEVAMGERLLASAAGRGLLSGGDELRDLLIEARLHVATADNHLDLLQIRLERVARAWDRQGPELGRGLGRD